MFRGPAYLADRGTGGAVLLWDRGKLGGLVMRRRPKTASFLGHAYVTGRRTDRRFCGGTERIGSETSYTANGERPPTFSRPRLRGRPRNGAAILLWDRTETF